MGWAEMIVNAVRNRREPVEKPRVGQLVRPEPLDRWREYPADGLTPAQLGLILRAADEGSPEQALALFEQMEEKDAHLYSVANTRRLAVTGLRWKVVSAADVQPVPERRLADEAADYCRDALASATGFDAALQHLSLAMGRNVAVAENVWEQAGGELRLAEVVPVPFDRLTFDAQGRLRVLTREAPHEGLALPGGKFIVHTPHAVSGHPMRGGLLRVSALAYLGKHFAMKDWLVFAEVFGMPLRVARYEPSATPDEKRELLGMLRRLGSDAAGVFSKAVELQLLEAGQGKAPPPYEAICNFFNRELSKAWLGATLAVEPTGAIGSLSVANLHDQVRLDIRQDDIARESRTLRRDLLAPLTRLRFGDDVPVPHFTREFSPPRDMRELTDVLRTAVHDLRMQVPSQWAHEALGLPMAAAGDRPVGRAEANQAPSP